MATIAIDASFPDRSVRGLPVWGLLTAAAIAPFDYAIALPVGGGLSLRLLHVWTLVFGITCVVAYRRTLARGMGTLPLLFWSLVLTIAVSTALATPSEYLFRGVADVGLLMLNIGAFTLVYIGLADRPAEWRRFMTVLVISSVLASISFCARALLAARSGLPTVEGAYMLGLGTVTGTYTTAFAAAAAIYLVFATGASRVSRTVGALIVHGGASLLSLARGPWIGFALGCGVAVPWGLWRLRAHVHAGRATLRLLTLPIALGTIGVILFVTRSEAGTLVARRLVQVSVLTSGTASWRLQMWQAMLDESTHSPLFGHGASAYRHISETLGNPGSVSENFPVEMLHAGGLMALFFFGAGILLALQRTLAPQATAHDVRMRAACMGGTITLLVGASTNPAAWLGLFWVLLAFVATM